MITTKTKKLYLTWENEANAQTADEGYFIIHESIEEAVGHDTGAEVFEASLKSIGKFKKQVTLVPIVEKKKKAAKKLKAK